MQSVMFEWSVSIVATGVVLPAHSSPSKRTSLGRCKQTDGKSWQALNFKTLLHRSTEDKLIPSVLFT